MVRSMVNTTSMGVDRLFWFLGTTSHNHQHICPIDANNNATPLLSVLATINHLLEDGDYAGTYLTDNRNDQVHVYKTSKGQAAVVWTDSSDSKTTVSLPVKGDAAVYAMTGELIKRYKDETISLAPRMEPLFVTADSFDVELTPRNAKLFTYEERNAVEPSKVVIDLFFENEETLYDGKKHVLSVEPGSKTRGTLYVYNFSDKAYKGTPEAKLSDATWNVQFDKRALSIEPMTRAALPFTLHAPATAKSFKVSTLRITTDSGRSVSQVRLGIDRRALPPKATLDLIDDVAWRIGCDRQVAEAQLVVEDSKQQVSITSKAPGNAWLTLDMIAEGGFDLADYDAIKVTLDVTQVKNPAFLDLRCYESNGAYYGMMNHPLKKGRLVLWNFFSDMRWVPWSMKDGPDFHLDTSSITKLQFLLGPENKGIKQKYAFEIEAVEALKW